MKFKYILNNYVCRKNFQLNSFQRHLQIRLTTYICCKQHCFCTFFISVIMLSVCLDSAITKIAHKQPIHLKEKSYSKTKPNASPEMKTTDTTSIQMSKEYDNFKSTTSCHRETSIASGDTDYFETISEEDTTTMAYKKTTSNFPSDDISCSCGIFLGSQFVKGSSEPPKGDPVISTTLKHSFPCNRLGQKQCQIKCLLQVVQHLASSANILCASLDRDIHKERAFLFIRNCNSKWHNTNLAEGREYCCKNSLPYNCPKKYVKSF